MFSYQECIPDNVCIFRNIFHKKMFTDDEESEIKLGKRKFTVKPVYQWLLEYRY